RRAEIPHAAVGPWYGGFRRIALDRPSLYPPFDDRDLLVRQSAHIREIAMPGYRLPGRHVSRFRRANDQGGSGSHGGKCRQREWRTTVGLVTNGAVLAKN